MNDLFDKIQLAREGGAVERCHLHPHSRSYTNGQHTYDLMTLLILTWQEAHDGELPRAELLSAAAFHDTPERITGDFPSNVKGLLNGALDGVEARVLDWMGVSGFMLTLEEINWLRACDSIELYLWCIDEVYARGVVYFEDWITEFERELTITNTDPVFIRVMREAKANQGRRLHNNHLKEIAGL